MSAIWFQQTDFARLVGDSAAVDTELSIGELPRVAAAGLPGSGPFHVRFGFRTGRHGIVLADGELRGMLKIRCQRCLDEMEVGIDSSLRLALLVSEAEAELIPAGYEPLTIPGGKIRVADLIEDEVLLGLPIAPKHADDGCGPLSENLESLRESRQAETSSPFAGLAVMLRADND